MRRYIIVMTAIVASLLTIGVLGIVNYYTCFAYDLPHKSAIIELAPDDILVEYHPEVITIRTGLNKTTIDLTSLPAR